MSNLISLMVLLFAMSSWNFASAADEPVSLPCVDAAGALKNADPANVCKAMIPKCSDLKKKLVDQLKDTLEWKIYGYYYLGKDIKLDKISGMKAGNVADGEPLPYPICSVVGHKVSGNEAGEISNQSIAGGKSCGEFPTFQNGDAWNYRTRIQYNGESGKRWYSYVLGAYPWSIRRNAYEVIYELKDDLSNLSQVIKTAAMIGDVKSTLELMKKATLALSAESKNICNQPAEKNIVESCMSGTLAITDPVHKLCTLAKAQIALNEVSLPNMLVYEVMARAKAMHESHFGNVFDAANNAHFFALVKHCSDNKSLIDKVGSIMSPIGTILLNAIQANKSYSCNTSCMTDGEDWYTNTTDGDGKSWKNSGGSGNRRCKKQSKFDLNTGTIKSSISSLIASHGYSMPHTDKDGKITFSNENTAEEQFTTALGLSNPTNNVGFAGMIESIIRRDICPQAGHKKTGTNVCDDVGINNKPAGK